MPNKNSDEQLEELLSSGFRFAFSLTHRQHDAEDLLQEAWMRLFRKYKRVENRSILFTAIRNLFYDRCRHDKIIPFQPLEESDGGAELALDQKPGVRGDLSELLKALEPTERETLFLNCVEGYTAKEIGEFTGRPRGTVLGILSRAQKKLRSAARADEKAVARQLKSPKAP